MSLSVSAQHRLGAFSLDVSFTSDRGVTALFGRSGSGKTSLVRIIAGLIKPDAGRIVLAGDVLTDRTQGIFIPKHKRRFGYVFQEPRLFPHLTVRQNLTYGRWFSPASRRTESLERIVELLGIGGLLSRHPDTLSGGEKQRVAMGRALLCAPRLLLMDEPLAALDDARKAEILPYLERLRDEMGIPIVYVSHSVAEIARLADRVVALHDGRVTAVGPVASILQHPSLDQAGDGPGTWLEGRITAIDPAYQLATVALLSNQLTLPYRRGALGARVRVHLPAQDVMLATARPQGLSALNILTGIILEQTPGPDGLIDVAIDCAGDRLRARLTALSVETLGLVPGTPVFAIIKSAALAED